MPTTDMINKNINRYQAKKHENRGCGGEGGGTFIARGWEKHSAPGWMLTMRTKDTNTLLSRKHVTRSLYK